MPATHKERVQLYAVLGLAGAILCYALCFLVLRPLWLQTVRLKSELTQLQLKVDRARTTARSAGDITQQLVTANAQLAALTNRYMLTRVLGSYPVRQNLRNLTQDTGFDVLTVREVGKLPTPRPPKAGNGGKASKAAAKPASAPKPAKAPAKPAAAEGSPDAPPAASSFPPAFMRYVAEVTGVGTYQDVADLMARMEVENPYLGVVDLTIRSVPQTPEKHRVSVTLEWPVACEPGDAGSARKP